MAGTSVKTAADGRKRYLLTTVEPTGPSVAAFATAVDVSCDVADSTSWLRAAASDTFQDPAACDLINVVEQGAGNFEAQLAPFVLLDDGKYVLADNPAFEALRERGTELWLTQIIGITKNDELAAGYLSTCVKGRTDEPQFPMERGTYVKAVIPLQVLDVVWANQVLEA